MSMMGERATDLTVLDAMVDATRTVGPETPLTDVVDVMVRYQIGAVPVVGDGSEVLGIITSGDALDQMLRDTPGEGEEGKPSAEKLTARSIMTRTVLCVSEAQPLIEAAHMMVNKKVEQLPVVREGELVGLITRDRVLSTLYPTQATNAEDNGEGSDS